MEDYQLLKRIETAKDSFGVKCRKYAGSVTVELILQAFKNHGIQCSPRDVFIKGVPNEFDLLIPEVGVIPENDLLYQSHEVLAALEIKKQGSYGESTVMGIKKKFELVKRVNPKIMCAYVTIAERRGYKWSVLEENIGFPVYTLFWHNGSVKKFQIHSSGDWARLIKDLKSITAV